MDIKIDKFGYIHIKRGSFWKPLMCCQSSIVKACQDSCPLFEEYTASAFPGKIFIIYRCANKTHVSDDLIKDERTNIKDKQRHFTKKEKNMETYCLWLCHLKRRGSAECPYRIPFPIGNSFSTDRHHYNNSLSICGLGNKAWAANEYEEFRNATKTEKQWAVPDLNDKEDSCSMAEKTKILLLG